MKLAHTTYKAATLHPTPEVAGDLQRLLGQKLVAYAVGVRSPKLVGRWAAGDHDPRPDSEKRLREMYRVWLTLKEGDYDSPSTLRAFLMGSNPNLQDRAPIDVIRDGQGVEAVHAAEAFVDY
jgi:uncharacterized protein (DUF2384 family)